MNFAASETAPFGARYLEDPTMFPLGFDGESWGTRELSLGVLDKRFLVCGLSAAQEHTIRSLWPRFIVDDSDRAAMALFVRRAPASTFIKFDRWEYDLELDYAAKSLSMAGLDLMARLELVPELRAALWVATEEHDLFHSAFENFLRILVAYAALDLKGGLFHSAAVVEGDSAWLFVGHSGAGKSTVSRLALDSGRAVLSDDLNPVLPNVRGGLDIVGSPFLGDEGARTPTRHTLSAIYRLEQGAIDGVRTMGEAETLASLMASSPYLNQDPHRTETLCKNLAALAGRVPQRVLTFRREGTFWPLLERNAGE